MKTIGQRKKYGRLGILKNPLPLRFQGSLGPSRALGLAFPVCLQENVSIKVKGLHYLNTNYSSCSKFDITLEEQKSNRKVVTEKGNTA